MKKTLILFVTILCLISCSKKYSKSEILEIQNKSTCYEFENKFSICFPDSWNQARGATADSIFRVLSRMVKRNEHMYIFKHYYADKRKDEYVLYMPRILVEYCKNGGITNQVLKDHFDVNEYLKKQMNISGIRTYNIHSAYYNEKNRELYFDVSYVVTQQLHYYSPNYMYMSYLNEKAPIQTFEYRFKKFEKFANPGSIVLIYEDCYSYIGEKQKQYDPIYKNDFKKIIKSVNKL